MEVFHLSYKEILEMPTSFRRRLVAHKVDLEKRRAAASRARSRAK